MKELGSWTLWRGLLPPTRQAPIFPRPLSTSGWMSGELSGAEMSFPQTPPLESPWKTPASHLWHEMVQPRPRSSLYPLFSIHSEASADSPLCTTAGRLAQGRAMWCSSPVWRTSPHPLGALPDPGHGRELGKVAGRESPNLRGPSSRNPLPSGKSYGPFLRIMLLN